MNAYEFEAVIYDGDVYCVGCLPDGVGVEDIDEYGNDVCAPIFANSEWDYVPVCCECGQVHDYINVIVCNETNVGNDIDSAERIFHDLRDMGLCPNITTASDDTHTVHWKTQDQVIDDMDRGVYGGNTYYCEYCDEIFEYRDPSQQGCERCNRLIDDNDNVSVEYYGVDES